MGNCSPEKQSKDISSANEVEKKQAIDDAQNYEKLSTIISSFQSENEKMKKELASLKNQNEQNAIAEAEQKRQNEEVMKELESIKNLMNQKEQALVLHRLRAALHTKASALMCTDAFSVKLQEGQLIKYRKAGKTKTNNARWVELYFIPGESRSDEFVEGHLMLTYAEDKESQISNRGRVLKVIEEPTNVDKKDGTQFFSVLLRVNGLDKEMVFACSDEKEREGWIGACNDGLSRIEQEVKAMNEEFTLKLEFEKKKLGFVVEESFLITETGSIITDTTKENQNQVSASIEDQKVCDDNQASTEDKKPSDDNQENEDIDSKAAEVEVKPELVENPCKLVVSKIKDSELFDKGLVENCILRSVNDVHLEGMVYTKQINILNTTKKPFMITFTGQNFLKKKTTTAPLYTSILSELTAKGDNEIKSAFFTLIKGTPLEAQLADSGDNSTKIIEDLLSNQRRILTLLQSVTVQEADL